MKRWMICLCLCVMMGLLWAAPAMAASAEHSHCVCGKVNCTDTSHATVDYMLFTSLGSEINVSCNIALDSDISLSKHFRLKGEDTVVNLCLNGKVLDVNDLAIITDVDSGVTLNICDCGSAMTYGSINDDGLWERTAEPGTDDLRGGVITGGGNYFGAVYVISRNSTDLYPAPTLNLYGGNIAGNAGSAVEFAGNKGSRFNMYGGVITGNKSGMGAGVDCDSPGTFTMYGGAITRNTNTDTHYGGSVYCVNGPFVMKGGEITDNVGSGGVFAGGPVTLDGKVNISGNVSSAGSPSDIYINYGKAISLGADFEAVSPISVVSNAILANHEFRQVVFTNEDVAAFRQYFKSGHEIYSIGLSAGRALQLDAAPLTITTDSIPDAWVSLPYSFTLNAVDSMPVTWSVENGELPEGLELNAKTGEISGTPTEIGSATFTLVAQNVLGVDMREFTLTVKKVPVQPDTGDDSQPALYLALLMGSLVCMIALKKRAQA